MNKLILAIPVLAVLPLAACHSSGKANSAKASARAFASSSAGASDKAQAQALVKKCFPASETAQVKLSEPSKGKPARKQVETCLAIPPQNRTPFDDALLNALLHGHVRTAAGRDTLITVTIPALVVKYQ